MMISGLSSNESTSISTESAGEAHVTRKAVAQQISPCLLLGKVAGCIIVVGRDVVGEDWSVGQRPFLYANCTLYSG